VRFTPETGLGSQSSAGLGPTSIIASLDPVELSFREVWIADQPDPKPAAEPKRIDEKLNGPAGNGQRGRPRKAAQEGPNPQHTESRLGIRCPRQRPARSHGQPGRCSVPPLGGHLLPFSGVQLTMETSTWDKTITTVAIVAAIAGPIFVLAFLWTIAD
jgi:hypothetical protein